MINDVLKPKDLINHVLNHMASFHDSMLNF